ncbi:hypothetical protein [Lysobacter sp. CA199]|uniref:hypothetical protein n=1 Tax=Lysobacter sp. CA199 TaxID=3455608 RepID=UPI003F8D67D7
MSKLASGLASALLILFTPLPAPAQPPAATAQEPALEPAPEPARYPPPRPLEHKPVMVDGRLTQPLRLREPEATVADETPLDGGDFQQMVLRLALNAMVGRRSLAPGLTRYSNITEETQWYVYEAPSPYAPAILRSRLSRDAQGHYVLKIARRCDAKPAACAKFETEMVERLRLERLP